MRFILVVLVIMSGSELVSGTGKELMIDVLVEDAILNLQYLSLQHVGMRQRCAYASAQVHKSHCVRPSKASCM